MARLAAQEVADLLSHFDDVGPIREVAHERVAQDRKWGEQNHPDGTGGAAAKAVCEIVRAECDDAHRSGRGTWRHILDEEMAEAYAESDPAALRAELVQVAAVAVAWVEAIDRRQNGN